ncbi:AraC family transcriptional regulator [Larsenimonas salina]|uniref:AraC family transcriptional regulator n=1 Tax=Larsenimonas salina TaxID=1295565 RepID=UPI002074100B|nr:AraC family transcriptional regulator [Larsenimonas salina]MCM5703985.1 AraC family transcriptional regulator [Larsenimonas salina]
MCATEDSPSLNGQRLECLIERIDTHARQEGIQPTSMAALQTMRLHTSQSRQPQLYEPGLVIIAQGRKYAHLSDRTLYYGAGHYLIQAMPLPFECETRASADAPLLGLLIRITPERLTTLVRHLPPPAPEPPYPMEAIALDDTLIESLLRLLDCLDDPVMAAALGEDRLREAIFHALRGPQGDALKHLLYQQGQHAYARIGRVLEHIQTQFDEAFSVEALARTVHMSTSAFYYHFKQITGLSPLQYQKQVRLLNARRLLAQAEQNVSSVARTVGYLSPSQFSREYKRYFGVSPQKDARPTPVA